MFAIISGFILVDDLFTIYLSSTKYKYNNINRMVFPEPAPLMGVCLSKTTRPPVEEYEAASHR